MFFIKADISYFEAKIWTVTQFKNTGRKLRVMTWLRRGHSDLNNRKRLIPGATNRFDMFSLPINTECQRPFSWPEWGQKLNKPRLQKVEDEDELSGFQLKHILSEV